MGGGEGVVVRKRTRPQAELGRAWHAKPGGRYTLRWVGGGGWQTELAGDCLMLSNALDAATVIIVAAGVERRTRL